MKPFSTPAQQLLSVKVKSSGKEHVNFTLMLTYVSVMNQNFHFSPPDDLRSIVFLNPVEESLC